MNAIDYTRGLQTASLPAYLVTSTTLPGNTYVFYVAHGAGFTVSPFNEYGEPYSAADILALDLVGVESVTPLINVGVSQIDKVYLVKRSDAFTVTSDLDSFRKDCQIVGSEDVQMVLRVEVPVVDGSYVDGPIEVASLPVSTILSNSYYG